MSILFRLTTVALLLASSAFAAAKEMSGRWEGSIQIPGRELPLIIDLKGSGEKELTGSVIIQGLGVKGVPLADFAVKANEISFVIKDALGNESVGPAKFQGSLSEGGDVLSGNFVQAGNSAPFSVRKTGTPQVDPPRRSTAIGKDLVGEWKGDYEMDGYPRHVTLTLANSGSGSANAQFAVVGKRTNKPPVEFISDENGFLTFEAPTFGITYEGRLRKEAGEIKGTFKIGPFERPLVLKRTP
ncbi:MAG TPA: hypothetical protein VGL24_02185 [Chthoniobacterales bacterium]